MSTYASRIARVQNILREERLAAAVLAPTDQMRYLSGWAEGGHERLIAMFVPAEGEPAFVVPAMNLPQARGNPAGVQEVIGWDDAAGWQPAVLGLLARWSVNGRGLAIDDELQSGHLLAIQNLFPGTPCVPAGELMARLREIKSADENSAMRRSGKVTDTVYGNVLGSLREGMTEVELQDAVVATYKQFHTSPEFALICFGANSALPHHHTGNARLKRGDIVVIDIGCRIDGYASDITRTIAFGEPDPEAKNVYEVVFSAHQAAFDRVRPGVSCEEIDEAARSVIEHAGYGDYFVHRTGHGIGLSTHEPPYIVAGNLKPLLEGMCFSDEPGIYLPGRFGVRIENIVTVTADGAKYLNADPPEQMIVLAA